jgi:serine/threonine-protein kinase
VLGYASGLAQALGRFDIAMSLGEYALKLDPLNPARHNLQGVGLRFIGRHDEAIAELRKVLELSPGDISAHYRLCEAYLAKGDAKSALAEVQQEPHEAWRLTGLAMAFHALKRDAESDAALAELIKKFSDSWPYNIAYVYALRNDRNLAFKYLEMARKEQDPGLSDVAVEPFFDNLKSDARWLPLMTRLGMSSEQRAAIKFDVKLPAA